LQLFCSQVPYPWHHNCKFPHFPKKKKNAKIPRTAPRTALQFGAAGLQPRAALAPHITVPFGPKAARSFAAQHANILAQVCRPCPTRHRQCGRPILPELNSAKRCRMHTQIVHRHTAPRAPCACRPKPNAPLGHLLSQNCHGLATSGPRSLVSSWLNQHASFAVSYAYQLQYSMGAPARSRQWPGNACRALQCSQLLKERLSVVGMRYSAVLTRLRRASFKTCSRLAKTRSRGLSRTPCTCQPAVLHPPTLVLWGGRVEPLIASQHGQP